MRIIILLSCLLLFSCNNANNKTSSISETKTIPTGKKILLSNIKAHLFSDSLKKDTFKLILIGDSLLTSSAFFSIKSYKGKLIYSDSFGGNDLSYDYHLEKATLPQLKIKVAGFFDDSNFVNACKVPVIGTCGDNGYPDSVSWFDIHSYKNAIGFHYYFAGELDDNYIAWSKKQQKVVIYWYNND